MVYSIGDISIVNGMINQLITWGAPPCGGGHHPVSVFLLVRNGYFTKEETAPVLAMRHLDCQADPAAEPGTSGSRAIALSHGLHIAHGN